MEIKLKTNLFYIFIFTDFDQSVEELKEWLDSLNAEYLQINQYSSYYTWKITFSPSSDILKEADSFGTYRANWKNEKCSQAANLIENMNFLQKRMIWILCRGPRYTKNEARLVFLNILFLLITFNNFLVNSPNFLLKCRIHIQERKFVCQNHLIFVLI